MNTKEEMGPNIDQHFYKQLTFDKDIKIIQWESLFTNGDKKLIIHMEKQNEPQPLPYT